MNIKLSKYLPILVCSTALLAPCAPAAFAQGRTDSQILTDVQKSLDKKQFRDVKASVDEGRVTLTGNVDYYAAKEDADRRAHHRKNVKSVDNEIQVGGPHVEDNVLLQKLSEKLEYDRVGYGTTAFNNYTLAVHDGVVTVGGTAYGPTDKDSALSVVSNYPGVKDVIDDIEVAPLSPNDDRIRIDAFRAIYGYGALSKYAMDPGKPIRITVVNGNITLNGLVNSQADKDMANLRANGVPGAFKVTNNLQVAGRSTNNK